jgi:hypothetical protein
MIKTVLSLSLVVAVGGACKKTSTTSETPSAPPAQAAQAPVPAPTTEKTVEPAPAGGPATELAFDAALSKGDDLQGKPVIVTAISWGTSDMATGGKRLNLGGAKLEGSQQAHLVADFSKTDLAQLDPVKSGDPVKLRCTMGDYDYGARHLDGCQVVR